MRAFTNFVYGVALMMMVPIGTPTETRQDQAKNQLIEAAKDSFADVDYMCKQHPKVCDSAAGFALDLEHKARTGLSYFNLWTADSAALLERHRSPAILAVMTAVPAPDLRPALFN